MKNKTKIIRGDQKQITIARTITYSGRKMSDVRNFLGIWYWFYLLN